MAEMARIKTTTPVPYLLSELRPETHDTKTFRFTLPADAALDMLPGDYVTVHATVNGKTVKRPYTPSSLVGTVGSFELTIKRYETGTVSKFLHDRRVGDRVMISGPHSGGHWVDGMATKAGFIAGGTGITPMISIIRWIVAKRLPVGLWLVYANKTEADVILRDEFDQAARAHSNVHCYHVLEQPPPGWTMGTGRITPDVLRAHLPPPGPDTVVFLCGPPPMANALEGTLKSLGYPDHAIILP